MIKFERVKEGYYFWLFKGIVEIAMAFFILHSIRFGVIAGLLISILYTLFVIILIFFGVDDLRYFLKLKDEKYKEEFLARSEI